MSKKIVLSIERMEVKKGGAEIFAVNLSDDALEGLSTNGAEIPLPPDIDDRPRAVGAMRALKRSVRA